MKTLLALAALLVVAPELGAQDLGLKVGSRAPAAIVQSLDGRAVDLSQYVGKVPVFIEFWATWCPNCRELEPQLLSVQKKYGGRMKFLGVAVAINQTPERVKLYAQKHGFAHEVLFDRTGDAADKYDVPATSYVVVVDRRGTVVYTGQGGDQNLEGAVRKGLE
jgi:thiol-disulfide isomerase/thioredoxin